MKPGPGFCCLSLWQTSCHLHRQAEWSHRLDQPIVKIRKGEVIFPTWEELSFQNHWKIMSIIHLDDAPRHCHCHLHAVVVHRLCRRPRFLMVCAIIFVLWQSQDLDIHVSTRGDLGSKRLHHRASWRSLPACGWVSATASSPFLHLWRAQPSLNPSIITFSARGRPVFESFRHGPFGRTRMEWFTAK